LGDQWYLQKEGLLEKRLQEPESEIKLKEVLLQEKELVEKDEDRF
jgi:hypothetical protein